MKACNHEPCRLVGKGNCIRDEAIARLREVAADPDASRDKREFAEKLLAKHGIPKVAP